MSVTFVMPSYFIFVETTPTPPGQAAGAAGANTEHDVESSLTLSTGGMVKLY